MDGDLPPATSSRGAAIEKAGERANPPSPNSPASNLKSSATTPRTSLSASPSPLLMLDPPSTDLLDDVFGSDSFEQDSSNNIPDSRLKSAKEGFGPNLLLDTTSTKYENHPSDIPRLRSVHATAGYRDGVAAARDAAVQGGFDEGYLLGATLGIRVGVLVGLMEGLLEGLNGRENEDQSTIKLERGEKYDADIQRGLDVEVQVSYTEEKDIEGVSSSNSPPQAQQEAVGQSATPVSRRSNLHKAVTAEGNSSSRVREALKQMHAELAASNLLGQSYINADGTWKWAIDCLVNAEHGQRGINQEDQPDDILSDTKHTCAQDTSAASNELGSQVEEAVDMETVADAHPLIRKWTSITRRWMDWTQIRRDFMPSEKEKPVLGG